MEGERKASRPSTSEPEWEFYLDWPPPPAPLARGPPPCPTGASAGIAPARPPTPELEFPLDSPPPSEPEWEFHLDWPPPPAPLARGPPPYLTGASAGLALPPPLTSPRRHPFYSPFPLETEWPAPAPRPLPSFASTEGMAPVHSNYPRYPPLYEGSYWGQAYSPGAIPTAAQALMAYLDTSDANVHPHHSSGFPQQYLPQAVNNDSVDVGSTGLHGSMSYAVNPGEPYVNIHCRQQAPKKARLFVFHVPNAMTNEALYRLFEPHGTILNLRIETDNHTGRGKGYAFVNYASAASAENAIHHLDGKFVMGKYLKVEHKKETWYEGRRLLWARGGGPRSPGRVGRPGARRSAGVLYRDSAPAGRFADMEDLRNSLPEAQ